MFRYVLSLLMVNTFYQSLGVPIEPPKAHFVMFSLKTLAEKCGNQFLAENIKNRTNDCAVVAPPYLNKQLQCLMFYDINSQLCAAASKLPLIIGSASKINEELNINQLCYNVKNWTFTNFTEYSQYKGVVEKYLKHPVTCGKMCGVEDIVNENTNFFCKYFNWGNNLLNSLTQVNETVLSGTNDQAAAVHSAVESVVQEKKGEVVPAADHIPIEKETITNDQPLKVNEASIKTTSVSNDVSTTSKLGKQETTSSKIVASSAVVEPDKSDDADLNVGKLNEHSEILAQNAPLSNLQDKNAVEDTLNLSGKATSGAIQDGQSSSGLAPKDTVLDSPKLKQLNEGDPYYPDDDSKGVLDLQGGDDEMDQANPDPGQESNKILDKNLAPINGDLPQKTIAEYLPNPIQEGFSDDDDHFFPFFLSIVVLVVLLYVLYHNKSKVSKVVLGLIFEGRQGGRRRNSRGHAYRRLDTLEQAMTNKAAAAPSKIIY